MPWRQRDAGRVEQVEDAACAPCEHLAQPPCSRDCAAMLAALCRVQVRQATAPREGGGAERGGGGGMLLWMLLLIPLSWTGGEGGDTHDFQHCKRCKRCSRKGLVRCNLTFFALQAL